jgi:hypothetical protein
LTARAFSLDPAHPSKPIGGHLQPGCAFFQVRRLGGVAFAFLGVGKEFFFFTHRYFTVSLLSERDLTALVPIAFSLLAEEAIVRRI